MAHLQVGGLLQVLDPLVGLTLWVDHEGPPTGRRHHDPVLDGERVVGQPGDQPLPHLHRLRERRRERELGCVRDLGTPVGRFRV